MRAKRVRSGRVRRRVLEEGWSVRWMEAFSLTAVCTEMRNHNFVFGLETVLGPPRFCVMRAVCVVRFALNDLFVF